MYAYNTDIYCDTCADNIKEELGKNGQVDTLDSNEYPQFDYDGEYDCPQYCAECGKFLENSLTEDGRKYVMEQHMENPSEITAMWVRFYGLASMLPLELHVNPLNIPLTAVERKLNNLLQQFCDDDHTGESMRIITDHFVVYLRVKKVEDK